MQLLARLLANSPRAAERKNAISILQRLDQERQRLDSQCRYLLAKQCLADGDWNQYADQMVKLICGPAIACNANSSFAISSVPNWRTAIQVSKSQAELWARRYQQDWPNDMDSAMVVASVAASGTSPQADVALATIKKAVNDDEMQPKDKMTRMAMAANELSSISQRLDNYLEQLRDTIADAGDDPSGAKPKLSADELAARKEIAKELETDLVPLNSTVKEYLQQIIGDDESLQLMWVPFRISQGQTREALELMQQHWEKSDYNALATAFAALMRQPGLDTVDRQAMEQLLKQAVAKYADQPQQQSPLLRMLGAYYTRWGRLDEAISCYQQIVSNKQGDAATLNNLAMLIASHKNNVSEALATIDQAIKMAGPQTTFVDTQAMVLLAAGKTKEALEAMNQVLANEPSALDERARSPSGQTLGRLSLP